MKAQKAASVAAAVMTLGSFTVFGDPPRTHAEALTELHLCAGFTVAEQDGTFRAEVLLDELPAGGISALEFAIAYDPAVLSITQTELLYDTGAQEAEIHAHPDLAGTVFTCEQSEGLIKVRWVTALTEPDYWLREERALLCLKGAFAEGIRGGERTALQIVPAPRVLTDGTVVPGERIAAGCLDTEGNVLQVETCTENGTVAMPIDATGATLYGDVDLDGSVTTADGVLMQRFLCEDTVLRAAAYANADCDADGLLTVSDLSLMIGCLSGA